MRPSPLRPSRGVQPMTYRLHVAQDIYEYGPTQNCKLTPNILRFVLFSLVFVYLYSFSTVAQRWQKVGHLCFGYSRMIISALYPTSPGLLFLIFLSLFFLLSLPPSLPFLFDCLA